MSYPHSIARALRFVAGHRALCVLHVLAGVAWGAAAYGWLFIPEAAVWQLVLSALLAVALAASFVWLHGGTLLAMGESGGSLWRGLAAAARRVPALLVWSAVLLAALQLLYAGDEQGWATVIASWLTLNLRRPVSPAAAAAWLLRFQTFLAWFLFALWLPMSREIARAGFGALRQGWPKWRQTVGSLGYWFGVLALWLAGYYLPARLVNWVPAAESLWLEAASAAARLGVALILAFLAWLALVALVAQPAAADPLRKEETPSTP